MINNSERDARMYLMRAVEHPSPATRAYAAEHGAVRTEFEIRNRTAPASVQAEVSRPDVTVADDIELLDTGEFSLVTPEHSQWPTASLDHIEPADRVFALWARGSASLVELTANAAAITGSRIASSYGTRVANDLARTIGSDGVTIVNGGSYGIDEAALKGAVAVGGRAVVVLPCGIEQPYPSGNARLFEAIIDHGGLVVSEYTPGCPPSRKRFAARARLIAALASVTVVVEAGKRSGAIALAQTAKRYGRTVLGVPGPIHSATSVGVHDLIRAGTANLSTAADDVLWLPRPLHGPNH